MSELVRQPVSTGRSVLRTARDTQLTFLAAAVAYYAFLSLVPLLALVLVASAALGGEEIVEELFDSFDAVVTPQTEELLREALVGGRARVGASLVSAGVVLWSALKALRALDTAFSEVYGGESFPSFARSVVDGGVVLAALPLGIGLTAAVPLAVRLFPLGPLARVATVLGGILGLATIFLPMYVVFPGREVSVRNAAPGALFAAIGWTFLGSAFSLYLTFAGSVALYGPLGGLLLLVMVLYAGAVILLFGAVLNRTLVNDRQLQQAGRRQQRVARTMPDDADTATAGTGDAEPGDRTLAGDAAAERDATVERDARSESERPVGEDASEFDPDNRTPGDAGWREEVRELRAELEEFREEVDDRTVDPDAVESDLKRYVRRRVRRGHAHGWGPYLVLLYGTAMTLGAFYLLSPGWAMLAMVVIWLSTLGLYALMLLVGFGLSLLGAPGRLRDAIGEWRS